MAYVLKLSRAGVPVELHLHPGAPHEFDSIAFDSDVARRAIARPRPRPQVDLSAEAPRVNPPRCSAATVTVTASPVWARKDASSLGSNGP